MTLRLKMHKAKSNCLVSNSSGTVELWRKKNPTDPNKEGETQIAEELFYVYLDLSPRLLASLTFPQEVTDQSFLRPL